MSDLDGDRESRPAPTILTPLAEAAVTRVRPPRAFLAAAGISLLGVVLGTEPLWAAAAGIALGGERLGALGLAGGVLVLGGIEWGRRAAG